MNEHKNATKTDGLPAQLKANVEAMSGFNMDDVIVHYNSSKPAQMKALAYTQGTDIHVAPGQEKHLGHEAWHVVQQKQGRVAPTAQLKGVNVNTDSSLEHEADVMGARASVFSMPDVPVVQRKKTNGQQDAPMQFCGDKIFKRINAAANNNQVPHSAQQTPAQSTSHLPPLVQKNVLNQKKQSRKKVSFPQQKYIPFLPHFPSDQISQNLDLENFSTPLSTIEESPVVNQDSFLYLTDYFLNPRVLLDPQPVMNESLNKQPKIITPKIIKKV